MLLFVEVVCAWTCDRSAAAMRSVVGFMAGLDSVRGLYLRCAVRVVGQKYYAEFCGLIGYDNDITPIFVSFMSTSTPTTLSSQERRVSALSGGLMLAVNITLLIIGIALLVRGIQIAVATDRFSF